MFTVCVLLYGSHTELAQRCLNSIVTPESVGYIKELRIGMNCVCGHTSLIVEELAKSNIDKYPIDLYSTNENTFKYPMMRNMFYHLPDDADVMWFDDDSYICEKDFWPRVSETFKPEIDMLGQIWQLKYQGNQKAWIRHQPWFNADVWRDEPTYMRFCQGAWWVAKRELIRECNWPIPELKHCGGDSMFGEVLRHKRKVIKHYDYGVRINADEHGRHSAAKRRGYTERVIGYDYRGSPLSTAHQDFFYSVGSYCYADPNRRGSGTEQESVRLQPTGQENVVCSEVSLPTRQGS